MASPQAGLRAMLIDFIEIEQPPWLQLVPYGRRETLLQAPPSIRQVFVEAGLAYGDDEETVRFWDALAARARGLLDGALTEIGRRGERLTPQYERNRTDMEPKWIALESASDGYDVLLHVAKSDSRRMTIEVKTSERSTEFASFHLTRNEWSTALGSLAHRFHLWVLAPSRMELAVLTDGRRSWCARAMRRRRWYVGTCQHPLFRFQRNLQAFFLGSRHDRSGHRPGSYRHIFISVLATLTGFKGKTNHHHPLQMPDGRHHDPHIEGEFVCAALLEEVPLKEHARPLAELNDGARHAFGPEGKMRRGVEGNGLEVRHMPNLVHPLRPGVLTGHDVTEKVNCDGVRAVHPAFLGEGLDGTPPLNRGVELVDALAEAESIRIVNQSLKNRPRQAVQLRGLEPPCPDGGRCAIEIDHAIEHSGQNTKLIIVHCPA